MGCGHHQFDPVQLVYVAGARIVIDGGDVSQGAVFAQRFLHPLPGHVVGKAGEGLETGDVLHPAVDEFDHFAGKQPSFSALISQRDHLPGLGRQLLDVQWPVKPLAAVQGLPRGLAKPLHKANRRLICLHRQKTAGQLMIVIFLAVHSI